MDAVLGLDLATRSGWTVIGDRGRGEPPLIEAGTWDCSADDYDGAAALLSDHLVGLLRTQKKNGLTFKRAGVEDIIRQQPTKEVILEGGKTERVGATNARSMYQAPALVGAACAILRQYDIPVKLVAMRSWRKVFIGTAAAPPPLKGEKARQWLKAQSKIRALELGARLGFKVPNADVADSCGVACYIAQEEGWPVIIHAMRRRAGVA